MNELQEIALKIYNAIFNGQKKVEIEGLEYKILKFSTGLRYVDIEDHRFIEQNQKKQSQWAKKAREGHKIMWVIKGRRYIAQIFDGEFKNL